MVNTRGTVPRVNVLYPEIFSVYWLFAACLSSMQCKDCNMPHGDFKVWIKDYFLYVMKYNLAESESALLDKEIWDGGISFINCILHLDIAYFCMQKVNLSPTFEVQIQLLFISDEYHLLKAISRWRLILYSVTFYANRLQISRTFFVKPYHQTLCILKHVEDVEDNLRHLWHASTYIRFDGMVGKP